MAGDGVAGTPDVIVRQGTLLLRDSGTLPNVDVIDLNYGRLDIDNGYLSGNACHASIQLAANSDTLIQNSRFSGVASVAYVNVVTAVTGLLVRNCWFNNVGTALTKNVVDTATGSKWSAVDCWDAVGSYGFSGGDNAAVAADDVSSVTTAVAAVQAQADKIDGAAVVAAPVANSLGRFIYSGGTARGTTLADSKSLVDALGFTGTAAVTSTAGMLRTMAGTTFVVSKVLTSSNIVQGGVDVTGVSAGGAILIEDICMKTDGTGLATATNFQLSNNNAVGATLIYAEAVASLGASVTKHMQASGVTAGVPFVLSSGKKITANCTVMDCTGGGTITIDIICRRLADGASLAAA